MAKPEVSFGNPKAMEAKTKELVRLMAENRPDITAKDLDIIGKAAIKYAKEILKGKAAVLYGMSLDWAIDALQDNDISERTKKDIVTKVLGHCLPTTVTIGVEDEETQPILFQMARPGTVNVKLPKVTNDDEPREFIEADIRGSAETEPVPSEPSEV
jgi:hypothetical protein